MGGAAGGKLTDEFRVEVFDILYPRRTTTGKPGQLVPLFKMAQEFGRFLHRGQIGAKTGIVHFVKSQPA